MIPVKLQIYNFLSYGEEAPVLDFTQFNIACLSGKNGQGKSALLDALTWAIWGEGRKASQEKKADSGLLKIGKNQMWVDLILDLEGDRYRIIRKFSRQKSRNYSQLELKVFDEDQNTFISLSSPSIRQTQQRINRLLKMDYTTFINSAFILQGRVDEFTRKSPRERKQILSEVLGLSHYEALSVLSRRYLRETEEKIIALNGRIIQIVKEIAQKESLQQEIQRIQQEEESLKKKIKDNNENLKTLETKQNKYLYEKERGKELIARIQSGKREIQEYEGRKKKVMQNIKEYRSTLSREKEIRSEYERYQNLYQENQRLLTLMQEYRKLEKDKSDIEQKIEKIKNHLQIQIEQRKQQFQEVQERTRSLSNQQIEARKLQMKIKILNELTQRQEEIQRMGNRLNTEIETRNVTMKRLQDEILKDHEKIDLLGKGKQKYCPLCESPLDDARKKKMKSKITNNITINHQKMKELTEEIKELSKKKGFLQKEWKENQHELINKEKIQDKLNTCLLLIEEGKQAKKKEKELRQEINELEKKFHQNQFAHIERTRLAEMQNQIQKQGYNDQKYVEINRSLEKLKKAPLHREKLMEAKKSMIDLVREQKEINCQLEAKEASIQILEQDYEKVSKRVGLLSELEEALMIARKLQDQLQQEQTHLYEKRGLYQGKLKQIEQYQLDQVSMEKQKERYRHQKELYHKLTNAFGKNGIQAMIIENAIPELEEEANAILSRLSDEETRISLESLKDLKSGGVKETLDIKIHDEMGIRSYELYSGGETFRIDFAIRIALSKLLTYRAGSRLRTLVIDEGFGTQDEEGLQKLIQAIHTIQNDFDKILVITHLSLLKDAFPVRIEVWKDPVSGSQFELVHL